MIFVVYNKLEINSPLGDFWNQAKGEGRGVSGPCNVISRGGVGQMQLSATEGGRGVKNGQNPAT